MEALRLAESWPVGSAALAVVRRGEGTCAQTGPDQQRFRLASVSKPLMAYAVLVAVEEGALGLDDAAGPAGSTVRHLLAHASGLAFDLPKAVAAPGTRRLYSNAGFQVLGEVLASATGLTAADYLAEAVCAPLGMAATRLEGSPAAGVVSTVADLAAFAAELLTPRLLHGSTATELASVQFPGLAGVVPGFGRQDPNNWGLGVELRDAKSPHWTGLRNSAGTFGHFGASGTFLWADPAAGLACVCLTDTDFGAWAAQAWPVLSDAVLAEAGAGGG